MRLAAELPARRMSDACVHGDGMARVPAGSEGCAAPALSFRGDENPPTHDSGDLRAWSIRVVCLNFYGTQQLCVNIMRLKWWLPKAASFQACVTRRAPKSSVYKASSLGPSPWLQRVVSCPFGCWSVPCSWFIQCHPRSLLETFGGMQCWLNPLSLALWFFSPLGRTTADSWWPETVASSKALLPCAHGPMDGTGLLATASCLGEQHNQHPPPILH